MRRYPLHPCALAVASLCYACSPDSVLAETYSSLPPPPSLQSRDSGQQYMLELVVNQQAEGNIVPAEQRDGHFWLRSGDLQRAGLPREKLGQQPQVDVSSLPLVRVDYDAARQRLLLTVPPEWLPGQVIGEAKNGPRYPGRTSSGALLE